MKAKLTFIGILILLVTGLSACFLQPYHFNDHRGYYPNMGRTKEQMAEQKEWRKHRWWHFHKRHHDKKHPPVHVRKVVEKPAVGVAPAAPKPSAQQQTIDAAQSSKPQVVMIDTAGLHPGVIPENRQKKKHKHKKTAKAPKPKPAAPKPADQTPPVDSAAPKEPAKQPDQAAPKDTTVH